MGSTRKLKPRRPLFERLRSGLGEGIEFARGKRGLKAWQMPQPPPAISAEQIARLRGRMRMSQTQFAGVLNVSPKTVQSWEQGTRTPSQSALRLIQLLQSHPEVVCDVVGI